jgi:hypothetical protein
MANAGPQVGIPGLSRSEQFDLRASLPTSDSRTESEKLPRTKLGEPFTGVIVVILTVESIKALATWLLKKKERTRIRQRFQRVYADGTREEFELDIDVSKSSAPHADVVRSIGQAFDVDPNTLAGALGASPS